jgi:acetylornithine aminotransferase
VVELPDGFMEAARELTRAARRAPRLDEIQTGAGRTGQWFGFPARGITPEAITVAKGIGGGFPIGRSSRSAGELFYSKGRTARLRRQPLATAVRRRRARRDRARRLVANAALGGAQPARAVEASTRASRNRGAGLLSASRSAARSPGARRRRRMRARPHHQRAERRDHPHRPALHRRRESTSSRLFTARSRRRGRADLLDPPPTDTA